MAMEVLGSTLLASSASSDAFLHFQPSSPLTAACCRYNTGTRSRFLRSQQQAIKYSLSLSRPWQRPSAVRFATDTRELFNLEEWNKQFRIARLQHLEAQALDALKKAVDTFRNPTFPCALIAGDVVILELLDKLGFLSKGRVRVVFIDTFHLFPETYAFLKQMEDRYNFRAHVFHAAGITNKNEYVEMYGSDLYIRNMDEYDKICKVEPFNRALATLEADLMINGRRRDHGAERAHLEVFEGDKITKLQPLAYWEFRDCWDFLIGYHIPYHPLHDQGFPSIGDVQTTVQVPKDEWFKYGGERLGRFQGFKNEDGSMKTECGIHVDKK